MRNSGTVSFRPVRRTARKNRRNGKMKARDVSFFKKNAWKGTYSSILTIPVEALSDKCFGAWLDIEDTNFAEATLPDEKLAGRFRELVDSDAEQAEWDEFYASVGKAFSAMSAH